nr:MAG TPA: hypothetical protein [Caudoviricetes sp.]
MSYRQRYPKWFFCLRWSLLIALLLLILAFSYSLVK